jgi:hypothetical protein
MLTEIVFDLHKIDVDAPRVLMQFHKPKRVSALAYASLSGTVTILSKNKLMLSRGQSLHIKAFLANLAEKKGALPFLSVN